MILDMVFIIKIVLYKSNKIERKNLVVLGEKNGKKYFESI